MIFSFPRKWTAKSFDICYPPLFNSMCQLVNYISLNPNTSGRNCQAFGHDKKKDFLPLVCCIFVLALTNFSQKFIEAICKEGFKCTLPPINCANYPHSLR